MKKTLAELGLTPVRGAPDTRICGLALNDRAVAPGFLFAALPGTRVHGAAFAANALRRGASAILTDRSGHAQVIDALAQHPEVALIVAEDAREAFARACALWFGAQPETLVAVTGTNGKTSVASFTRQIWAALGYPAINLGTLGIEGAWSAPLTHTTPDSLTLHARLAEAAEAGITHAAVEASSHGLDQRRLDGLAIKAAAFTNLSQDHLDYHRDMESYFAAKCSLFERLLPPEAPAVINVADPWGTRLAKRLTERAGGRPLWRVGNTADCRVCILAQRFTPRGQSLRFALDGRVHQVELSLVGGFQGLNALLALGLVLALGAEAGAAIAALPALQGVRGRMQLAAVRANGAPVFVDYAHTPAAVETALKALRPHAMGRLVCVLGAGGDRDRSKRPLMGRAACDHADLVIVTDDNPRSEDPAQIRAEILAGCPRALEIPDRSEAIARAIFLLEPGDVLVILGKGHESGQIIGDTIFPFDDVEQASIAVAALDGRQA